MRRPSALKSLNRGLLAILGVLIGVTIASMAFLAFTIVEIDGLVDQNKNNAATTLMVQELLFKLENADSSAGAYALQGRSEDLIAYQKTINTIPQTMKELRENNQYIISKKDAAELLVLANQKVSQLEEKVQIRTKGGADAAQAYAAQGDGDALIERARSNINNVSVANLKEIESKQLISRHRLGYALAVTTILSLLVLMISATLVQYFRRSLLHERSLENTKSEFLSLASHQLRTPATNVKLYIGMLMDGYLGDISDRQRAALQVAYKNNESEIHIMNDLLDVAKLDLHRIQLQKRPIDIVALTLGVIENNAQLLQIHGQKIRFSGPDKLIVNVDHAYFSGIIENLIDNASKYSKDGTRISVIITVFPRENLFKLTVRDRGPGIKRTDFSKLFLKFSRLENEYLANTEGSGLGLYWVREVLALHDGTIKVVSQEGKGSKFVVRAPIN